MNICMYYACMYCVRIYICVHLCVDACMYICMHVCIHVLIHSFIHSSHFYSAPSSHLLLRGAPDYSTDIVSEFHAEAHRQL